MISDGVLDAMHAALAAASAALAVPELRRNETLDSALEAVDADASAWANFVDGDLERIDQSLGGGFDYELRQTALALDQQRMENARLQRDRERIAAEGQALSQQLHKYSKLARRAAAA